MFVQLLLPELLWERKFCTSGEPRLSGASQAVACLSFCSYPVYLLEPLQEEKQTPLPNHSNVPSSPNPISPFQIQVAGTTVVHVDRAWNPSLLDWMPSGCRLSQPDSVMDGVIGDAMLTPAYLFYALLPQPQHIH